MTNKISRQERIENLIESLSEPSGKRGMVLLLTALGLGLTDIQAEHIITAGLALAGFLGAFVKDK